MKKRFLALTIMCALSAPAFAVPTYYFNLSNDYNVSELYAYYSTPNNLQCTDGSVVYLKLPSNNVLSHLYSGVVVPSNQLNHSYVCGSLGAGPECSQTPDVIFRGLRFVTNVPGFSGLAGTNCTNFVQTVNSLGWTITVPGGQSLTYMDLGFMAQYIFQ